MSDESKKVQVVNIGDKVLDGQWEVAASFCPVYWTRRYANDKNCLEKMYEWDEAFPGWDSEPVLGLTMTEEFLKKMCAEHFHMKVEDVTEHFMKLVTIIFPIDCFCVYRAAYPVKQEEEPKVDGCMEYTPTAKED